MLCQQKADCKVKECLLDLFMYNKGNKNVWIRIGELDTYNHPLGRKNFDLSRDDIKDATDYFQLKSNVPPGKLLGVKKEVEKVETKKLVATKPYIIYNFCILHCFCYRYYISNSKI